MDLKKPVPASHVVAVFVAVALILWRIWTMILTGVWRDWVVLLAVYGIFALFAPVGRFRTGVTTGAMAGFMLIYAWGHLPRLVAFLSGGT